MTLLKRYRQLWLVLAALLLCTPSMAADDPAMELEVSRISAEWARVKYQVHEKSAQYRQMEVLAGQAATIATRFPGRAEPLLWQGILISEKAGLASVFQQLGYATEARRVLERAEVIDPKAANGGVLMSLGVLYYRVPGFPIGFGSTKKARAYLERAIAMDPNGLESNYFYGAFLLEEGDRAGAKSYLDRALKAPVDPRRPVWDAGRRRDVADALAKLA
jgi:tetratricopeptide (TPR) repeat protein